MSSHHATTASCWVTDHLQTDSRKFGVAGLEFAGLYIEARHDGEKRTYTWFLDNRVVSREVIETAIDRRLNG